MNNKDFFKIVHKHFKYEIEDLSEEILWFLCNIVDEAPIDLINNILEIKLLETILANLYRETFECSILSKTLLFILFFIQASKKITLSDFIYFKIIDICFAYLYTKNDSVFKTCIEILVELTDYGSNSIMNQIVKTGIIPKLMKFDKFLKDLNIEFTDINLNVHLTEYPKKVLILILKFFGNILADHEEYDFAEVNFKKQEILFLKFSIKI